jgi:membrane fusion protein, macrolide-specific efflux system
MSILYEGERVMYSRFRSAIAVMLLVAILVTTVGCRATQSASKSEPTPTPIPPPPVPDQPTYTVKLGTVVDSMSFVGRVSPTKEEELFFRESGRIKKVYFERDQMVKAGDVLADLENDDINRQLAQSQIELETAKLNLQSALDAKQYSISKAKIDLEIKKISLAKLEAANNGTDLTIAKANMQRVEASLKQAQARYDMRAQRPGVESSGEALSLEQATIDYQIAKANYDKAVDKDSQAQYDIQIQRQQVTLAQLELDRLNKDLDPQLTKAVDRAQLSVERLQAQLANRQVISPIAGKVTSVSVYDGRDAVAYKAAFVVADESKLEITAEPISTQLQRLSEGLNTAIMLSSYPGKELPGKIRQLPYPYGKGGSTQQADVVDKLTHIDFNPQDIKVQPGDLVKVLVTLETKDNVLWLPPAAIRTFSGRKFVVVAEEGRQRRVDITIGIESLERVEIKDGLQENLVVVGQ